MGLVFTEGKSRIIGTTLVAKLNACCVLEWQPSLPRSPPTSHAKSLTSTQVSARGGDSCATLGKDQGLGRGVTVVNIATQVTATESKGTE